MEQWLPDVDRRRDVQCPLPSPRAACAARHRIHRSHREHHRRRTRALALLVRSPGCPAKPPPPPPDYRLTPPPVPASPTQVRLPTPNWWPTASTAPARLSTSRRSSEPDSWPTRWWVRVSITPVGSVLALRPARTRACRRVRTSPGAGPDCSHGPSYQLKRTTPESGESGRLLRRGR